MTGPTHRRFSVMFVCIVIAAMYKYGILAVEFNSLKPNYYLALILALPISKLGAKFPDVDHEWQFVSDKTVVNRIINTLIHVTGGNHRSWQTHSWDICLICTAAAICLPDKLVELGYMSKLNGRITWLIALSFMAGWISHMLCDMLNGAGVRVVCFNKRKIAFVPNKFLWIRFNTGNDWESFCYFIAGKINIILGVIVLAYPLCIA